MTKFNTVCILILFAFCGCTSEPTIETRKLSDDEIDEITRLFDGKWYPNQVESEKYSPNSEHVSELAQYFKDNVDSFSDSYIGFTDFGVSWSRQKDADGELEHERMKFIDNNWVNWGQFVDVINHDRVAVKFDSIWVVFDHWSTK